MQFDAQHRPSTAGFSEATSPPAATPQLSLTVDGTLPSQAAQAADPPSAATATATAQATFGRYLILGLIKTGGMGVVYRALDLALGREVALKTIRAGHEIRPGVVERFLQEAQAVARLKHPGVIQVHDFGVRDDQHFLVMALARGGSLAMSLAEYQAEPRRAVALMEKVALAVQHVHDNGILHRDLKPGNILLDGGAPLVSDFGLAKSLESELELTRTGSTLGTPAYMAPEQAAGRGAAVGPPADIWALGVILYELVCGQRPFSAESREEMSRAIQEDEPSAPRSVRPRLDRNLEAILLKCLEKAPSRRYASAGALADDLGAWLRGEPVKARQIGLTERARRLGRRYPKTLTLGAAAAAVVVAWMIVAHFTDPQRVERRWQEQLARGEEAIVIGPRGYPERRIWRHGKAVHDNLNAEGQYLVHAADLGMLELMSDVGLDRYKIRVELRHLGGEPAGEIGCYVGDVSYAHEGKTMHSFCRLTFNDFIDLSKIFKNISDQPVPEGNLLKFLPHVLCLPKIDMRLSGLNKHRFQIEKKSRAIELSVTEDEIRGVWDGADIGRLKLRQVTDKMATEMRNLPGAAPLAAQMTVSPRGGFGLYIDRASAIVTSVVVMPVGR